MTKKTTKIKTPEIIYPDAPDHLSDRAKKLWQEYVGEVLKSPGQFAFFQTGLEALDRADQAREILEREGLTVITGKTGVAHQHPALNILKEAEATVIKVWKTLGLHWPGKWREPEPPFELQA